MKTLYVCMIWKRGDITRGVFVHAKSPIQASKYLQLRYHGYAIMNIEEASDEQRVYAEKMFLPVHDACIKGGKDEE